MKKLISLLLILIILSVSTPAFAGRYYAHRGHFYHRSVAGFGIGAVTGALLAGAIIANRPTEKIVYVNSRPYYYDGSYYYQPCPQGYVIVQPPVNSYVMMRVPLSGGLIQEVELRQNGSQWIGQKGEIYDGFPTIDQLRSVYASK
jgi:hypothetical protein